MFEATTGYVQDGNPIKKTSCGRRRLKPGPLFKRVDKDKMPCNKPRTSTKPNKKKMVNAARKSFRARHKCGEKKSKLKAQYWACKVLWAGKGGSKKSSPKNIQGKY